MKLINEKICSITLTIIALTGCTSMQSSPQEYPKIERPSGGYFAPTGVGIIATDATNNLLSKVQSATSAAGSLEGLSVEDKG